MSAALMTVGTGAKAQVDLSTYADANGFLDIQALTCAQLAGTWQDQADLLGLVVTTSDINVQLQAQTGDGQILGNLLYNVSHLLDQGNGASLLFLLTQLSQL